MNIVDPDHGVLGCYGIVGGSIAAATGAALSLRGSGSVAVAYFGDGATNQAYFFECLNFAKVLALPVVFVCENNGYGEYTAFEDVTAGGIVPRAAAMECGPRRSTGWTCAPCARRPPRWSSACARGEGPEFVEARTYRFVGHSRSDPGKYRPEGELDRWQERDPLTVAATMLRDELGVAPTRSRASNPRSRRSSTAIEAAALAAPFPASVSLPEFAGG